MLFYKGINKVCLINCLVIGFLYVQELVVGEFSRTVGTFDLAVDTESGFTLVAEKLVLRFWVG